MRYLFVLLPMLLTGALAGQQLPPILSEADFLQLVTTHHPLSVRAQLQRDRAAAVLRMARGGFDPKLYGDLDQKYFKGSFYYSNLEGGVKIPTWFGIELNATYERNDGDFLNPEQSVPDEGLIAAGLSIALGRGLLFDERRAELQRAQIYQQATEAERLVLLNDLLYDAGKIYWEWSQAEGVVRIYEEAVEAARIRFEAVKAAAELGDSPLIDTLEAKIQLDNRRLSLQTAQLDLANTEAGLNAFLWLDGVVPVELTEDTRPPFIDRILVLPLPGSPLAITNPELLRTQLKIDNLEVDERLQQEFLKPQVDVKYNALLSGGTTAPLEDYSTNNYKWGVTVSQPLLLRKERGKLQMTRIKLSETQLELSDKRAALRVKIQRAENETNVTVSQYDLARQITSDYLQLLEGERTLFRAGESSLFLVNTREQKYIEARIKQVEILIKHRKARLAYDYALGRLWQLPLAGGPPPSD
jgi:outer membrane protein TolC